MARTKEIARLTTGSPLRKMDINITKTWGKKPKPKTLGTGIQDSDSESSDDQYEHALYYDFKGDNNSTSQPPPTSKHPVNVKTEVVFPKRNRMSRYAATKETNRRQKVSIDVPEIYFSGESDDEKTNLQIRKATLTQKPKNVSQTTSRKSKSSLSKKMFVKVPNDARYFDEEVDEFDDDFTLHCSCRRSRASNCKRKHDKECRSSKGKLNSKKNSSNIKQYARTNTSEEELINSKKSIQDDVNSSPHDVQIIRSLTRECAWRNTDTPNKKLKPTQKLLDEDGDVELLDLKQAQCELVENVSHMSDSVEKFPSPQSDFISVQGYKVGRSDAPVLEAIFKKHGDIAAKCVFKTNSVRSSFLVVVCEVVKRIQANDVDEKMEEIEHQVSDAEAANINVAWLRAHMEAINKRKDTSKKYSLLMETKESALLVKKAAQKDLIERSEELMVAQQRFKMAERCVRVLNFVEENLNVQIFESKSEIDSSINHPVV